MKLCAACSAELVEQRLLLCTLDSTFNHSSNLPLPTDFARVVAARAESDMSGVRDRRENTLALRLCAGLAIAAFALLVWLPAECCWACAGVCSAGWLVFLILVWTTVHDAVAGLTIISRVLGNGLFPGSLFAGLVALLLLGLVLLVFSRLIANYHRTRLID